MFLFTEFEGILRKYRNLFCNRKTYNFAKWVSRLLLHLNSKIFLNSCTQVLFMENLTRFLWLSKTDLVNLVLFEHIKLCPSKCLLLFSEFRRRKIKKNKCSLHETQLNMLYVHFIRIKTLPSAKIGIFTQVMISLSLPKKYMSNIESVSPQLFDKSKRFLSAKKEPAKVTWYHFILALGLLTIYNHLVLKPVLNHYKSPTESISVNASKPVLKNFMSDI